MFHTQLLIPTRISWPMLQEIMHGDVAAQLFVSTFKTAAGDRILNLCLPR